MTKRKPIWSLGKHDPFKVSFDKLHPQDKWFVEHAIQQLIQLKRPDQKYSTTQCMDCGIPASYHLVTVANDGTGNMGVELLFDVDVEKLILTPIFTRRTRLFTRTQLLKR